MAKLDQARGLCSFPWLISSGYRTKAHNTKIKGAKESFHAKGQAADIRCRDGVKRRQIVAAAIAADIGGIEICDGHVHLDDGPKRLWSDVSR